MKIELKEDHKLIIYTDDFSMQLHCTKEQLEHLGKQLFYEYGCIDWT